MCRKQLGELQAKLAEFGQQGVEVVAVSSNSREVAQRTADEWGLQELRLGYGLTMEAARSWGLFASGGIKDTEPEHFVEPALFVVRADGTLYASVVQTMPFSRPTAEQLLSSLTWIVENDYPPRGEADLGSL